MTACNVKLNLGVFVGSDKFLIYQMIDAVEKGKILLLTLRGNRD